MLIKTRKKGERIVIVLPDGRLVAVEVCGFHRAGVQLGVDAPPDVSVDRLEVHERKNLNSDEGTP